ncbi:Cell division protein ZapA [Pseudovibrio sp. W64]|uniref:cell division protein ZapA n=1 Tax=unclassified Pseudovibrio TaxID=2627060 RepID=UPI0007AE630C|nr:MULTISPECIES: cell division protein ZapA [unclassified Pseudovibrio]KZK88246.1 Cell division protein ZapA [Pseudovibrio sp. W64]KZK99529.1 Cell division protein ZapA [Pseudovibrio sp. Ad5]KZL04033.1 Cell division protein ZapA [Pseudovibrio sp. W74]KZL04252.1 Cell division protein ZapA [Pseudovibrio sp. Ad14]
MAQITVTINDRSFRMACDDGEEERLLGLAQRFDDSISSLRENFGEIGDQRLTVMAGIMVTDHLAEVERKLRAAEGRIEELGKAEASVEERLAAQEQRYLSRIEELEKEHREKEARIVARLLESADKIEQLSTDMDSELREDESAA